MLWHSCFPVNFAKFLRISFFTEHLRWLLQFLATALCLFGKWPHGQKHNFYKSWSTVMIVYFSFQTWDIFIRPGLLKTKNNDLERTHKLRSFPSNKRPFEIGLFEGICIKGTLMQI